MSAFQFFGFLLVTLWAFTVGFIGGCAGYLLSRYFVRQAEEWEVAQNGGVVVADEDDLPVPGDDDDGKSPEAFREPAGDQWNGP